MTFGQVQFQFKLYGSEIVFIKNGSDDKMGIIKSQKTKNVRVSIFDLLCFSLAVYAEYRNRLLINISSELYESESEYAPRRDDINYILT